MRKLSGYKENIEKYVNQLIARNIPYILHSENTLSVPDEHSKVITEFIFSYHMAFDNCLGVQITNNDGKFFGHKSNQIVACPATASDLLHTAKSTDKGWYFVYVEKDNANLPYSLVY